MRKNQLSIIEYTSSTINDTQIAIALGSYEGKTTIFDDSAMTESRELPLTAAIITEKKALLLNLERDGQGNFPWERQEENALELRPFCMICSHLINDPTPIINYDIYSIQEIEDEHIQFKIETKTVGHKTHNSLSKRTSGAICTDCLEELTPRLHEFLDANKAQIVTRKL